MPYYVRLIIDTGTLAKVATPYNSVEDAMTGACAPLRHGATEAWIVDHDEKRHADFEAIKKHCGMS